MSGLDMTCEAALVKLGWLLGVASLPESAELLRAAEELVGAHPRSPLRAGETMDGGRSGGPGRVSDEAVW